MNCWRNVLVPHPVPRDHHEAERIVNIGTVGGTGERRRLRHRSDAPARQGWLQCGCGPRGGKLSLFGGDPEADYDAIVRALEGRRVNYRDPAESLLFEKLVDRLLASDEFNEY